MFTCYARSHPFIYRCIWSQSYSSMQSFLCVQIDSVRTGVHCTDNYWIEHLTCQTCHAILKIHFERLISMLEWGKFQFCVYNILGSIKYFRYKWWETLPSEAPSSVQLQEESEERVNLFRWWWVAEARVEAATWQGPSWRAGGRSLTSTASGSLTRPVQCTRHGPHYAQATSSTSYSGSLVEHAHGHASSHVPDGWTLGAIKLVLVSCLAHWRLHRTRTH